MDRFTASVLIALCFVNPVHADQPQRSAVPEAANIRTSIEKIRFDVRRTGRSVPSQQQSAGGNRTARKIAMGIEFGLLGAVMGASIGGSVTQHCPCTEPGYGAFYGFPIGALAGAITGVWLASR